MNRTAYTVGRTYIGRIPKGADLLSAIARIANEERIFAGTVTIYGVVSRAAVSIFDPATKEQQTRELGLGMEIVTMNGTISKFKARAMPRLAAIFAAADGTLLAGTLALGTEVYACEAVIVEYLGATLSRDFDSDSGLPLWKGSALLADEPPGDAPEA